MVWMVTPLPVVTMPTMRSPGSGWQQPAKCSAMPGMRPRIGTAVSSYADLAPGARQRDHLGLGVLLRREDRIDHLASGGQPLADRDIEILDGWRS